MSIKKDINNIEITKSTTKFIKYNLSLLGIYDYEP